MEIGIQLHIEFPLQGKYRTLNSACKWKTSLLIRPLEKTSNPQLRTRNLGVHGI